MISLKFSLSTGNLFRLTNVCHAFFIFESCVNSVERTKGISLEIGKDSGLGLTNPEKTLESNHHE